MSADVLSFQLEAPLQLNRSLFATSLSGAVGRSELYKTLRVLSDDREGPFLPTVAAEDFARVDVPQSIFSAFM